MALLDKSKASFAFKTLQGKAHTSNLNELANEAIASGVTMSAQRIFAESIHPTPNDSSNTGIVSDELVLVLEAVAGTDTGQIGTPRAYRTKLGGTVPSSLVGKINPITNAVYAINDYVGAIIPQSFGSDFRPRLYSDAAATVEIPPSSAADWFIDCFSGVVTQEGQDEGSSAFVLGANGRVRAYVYVGQFVSDALGGSGAVNLFDGNGTTVETVDIGGTAGYAINLGGTLSGTTTLDMESDAKLWLHTNSNSFQLYAGEDSGDGFIQMTSRSGSESVDFYIDVAGVNSAGVKLTDNRNVPTGIEYGSNYSATYTNRSLVDKEYVDTQIGQAGTAGITTASNGLTKVGQDVQLGGNLTDDVIVGGTSTYALTLGSVGSSLTDFNSVGTGTATIDFPTINLNGNSANDTIILDSLGIHFTSSAGDITASSNNFDLDDNNLTFTLGNSATIDAGGAGTISLNSNNLIANATNFNVDISGTGNITTGDDFLIDTQAGTLSLAGADMLVTSANGSFAGVEYAADYSLNYSNRSLVDKEFVVTQIGYASTAGAVTASQGLTKVIQDIRLGGTFNTAILIDGESATDDGQELTILNGTTSLAKGVKIDYNVVTIGDTVNNGDPYIRVTSSLTRVSASGATQLDMNDSGLVQLSAGGNLELNATATLQTISDDVYMTANTTFTISAIDSVKYANDYSANFTARSLVDKEYVDTVAQGLDPKASVRAATTEYILLTGLQTIDGVTLIAGDRVLVKDQGTAGESNGIYEAAVGAWTRATDFDGSPAAEVTAGAYTFVEEGTLYQDTGWVLATNDPITLGTTSLSFVQFSAAGVVDAINGLTKTGSDIKLGGSLIENTEIDGAFGLTIGGNTALSQFSVFSDSVDIEGDIVYFYNTATTSVLDLGNAVTLESNANMTLTVGNSMFVTSQSVISLTSVNDTDISSSTGGINIVSSSSGSSINVGNNISATATNNLTLTGGSLTSNIVINDNGILATTTTDFSVDASTFTIVNALTSSTAGYDIVVRNSVTGVLESISGTSLTGSVPTLADKNLSPVGGTNGNGSPTYLTITYTPAEDSYVSVLINGIAVVLGTSSVTGDCYFALPGSNGVVGRAIADIQAGDEFYWNATIAEFDLDSEDSVDFLYNV